jgi:ribose transport system substrate-binding protein
MKPLRVLLWLAVACSPLWLLGCGGRSGKPKVAFVSNNPESFWTIAEAGARKAAGEFGVELLFRKPSSGDASVQQEVIDTVLQQGIKAIAISVIDPKNQAEYLDEIAGKVSLLTQDNDAPKTKRLAYIGTNNYDAGRAVGKLVKEAMPEGGTVVIFVGQLEPLNARQRKQGVIDEIAGRDPPADLVEFKLTGDGETFGKYKIYKKPYLDQPEGARKALDNAIDALAQVPADENMCMVGLWAYNPPQCLAAVKDKVKDEERRKKIKIVGFDEDFATLDGIKDGSIYATVVQDPYNFGYESVKLMAALAKGDKSKLPKDGMHYIPHRVIQKEAGEKNGLKRLAVGPFREKLEELLGK